MENTFDLTPQTFEIINEKVAKEFDCAGMRTGPDAVAEGEVAYLNSTILLPMYQTNVQLPLKTGESVKLNTLTADEAAHYLNACAELGLTVNPQ